MKRVRIVCDGSSLGNGRNAARAGAVAILEYTDSKGAVHYKVVGECLGEGTNNQAEIVAAAIGLEALKTPCDVEVVTDSRYVVETQNGNFRQKMNHEFWRRLADAARPHNVRWSWTKGHDNHPVQEQCDWAARRIAADESATGAILEEALGRVLNAVGKR